VGGGTVIPLTMARIAEITGGRLRGDPAAGRRKYAAVSWTYQKDIPMDPSSPVSHRPQTITGDADRPGRGQWLTATKHAERHPGLGADIRGAYGMAQAIVERRTSVSDSQAKPGHHDAGRRSGSNRVRRWRRRGRRNHVATHHLTMSHSPNIPGAAVPAPTGTPAAPGQFRPGPASTGSPGAPGQVPAGSAAGSGFGR